MGQGPRQQKISQPQGERDDDTQFVAAIDRGLRILDICAQSPIPLGNGEIARLTGLSAPTVSRMTYTLYRTGYLEYLPRERTYVPGGRAAALAATLLRRIDVRKVAQAELEALARDAHFNVGLGTLDGDMMVYLDAHEGGGLVGLRLRAGSHVPVLTSAMGRAYLAALSEEDRAALLERLHDRHGAEWSAIIAGIEQAQHDIATRGYCTSIGDWQKDINGVAVPITEPATGIVYAVNLGGPAYLMPPEMLHERLGPRLVETVQRIRSVLGEGNS